MKQTIFLLLAGGILLFSACLKNSSYTSNGKSSVSVHLVDDPGAYDKVNIDIQDIQVKADGDSSENGWQSLTLTRKGVYNLLDFKNGLDTLLGSILLPAGKISQLRLVLGANNSVLLNGTVYPLQTPSAQQSGLKLALNTELLANIDYHFWIDFDAARSIVQTGNNKYILKPVVKVFTRAETGAIKGVVKPASSKTWIFAIANAADTVSTTQADTLTGGFMLRGMLPASYKVAFHSTAGNYADTTVNNVSVSAGVVTSMDTVRLRLK